MLKVMIVDDEPLVRIVLKSIIPWEQHGFYILFEAENGKQCLDILEKNEIDILITDIKMPVIDGLELICVVKSKYPQISIMVLSAYEEFGLVKKALTSGADDYILKSNISEPETIQVLLAVKEKHLKKNIRIEQETKTRKHINDNFEIIKLEYIRDLVTKESCQNENMIEQTLKEYGIPLQSEKHALLVIVIDQDNSAADKEQMVEKIAKNFIEEYLKSQRNYYCFISDDLEVTVIYNLDNIVSEKKAVNEIAIEANNIKSGIKEFLGIRVTIAASSLFERLERISQTYEQTKKLIDYGFLLGREAVYTADQFPETSKKFDTVRLDPLYDQYRKSINYLFYNKACELLRKITELIILQRTNKKDRILKFYCKLLTVIVDKSSEMLLYGTMFQEETNPFELILNMKSIVDSEAYLIKLIRELEMASGSRYTEKYGETVGKTVTYLHLNYYKNINLNKVADELNYNSSYLSTRFKEKTGISFNEYLNLVRIENAKKLLEEKKFNINEISVMVGYNDQGYFSRIFKKIAGVAPSEYVTGITYNEMNKDKYQEFS